MSEALYDLQPGVHGVHLLYLRSGYVSVSYLLHMPGLLSMHSRWLTLATVQEAYPYPSPDGHPTAWRRPHYRHGVWFWGSNVRLTLAGVICSLRPLMCMLTHDLSSHRICVNVFCRVHLTIHPHSPLTTQHICNIHAVHCLTHQVYMHPSCQWRRQSHAHERRGNLDPMRTLRSDSIFLVPVAKVSSHSGAVRSRQHHPH